jgi:hypothetical protein
MARRSFFRWIQDAVRGLAGIGGETAPPSQGGGAGTAVPPPPPPPPPPEPPGPTFFPDFTPEPGNVNYEPRHTQFYVNKKQGKIYTGTIVGRWTVGNELTPPDISDVRDLVNASSKGPGSFITFIVAGIYFTSYPGQEGNAVTWLSYVYPYDGIYDYLNDPDVETGTDFMNELVAPFGEYWEEVYEIHILDN